jgi:alpha-L-arabinofuranosidase
VPVAAENIPMQDRPMSKRDSAEKITHKPVPTLFYAATKDTKTGMLYLKLVNTTGKEQAVQLNLKGVVSVTAEATVTVIKGDKPEDTNSITEPEKIIPASSTIKGVKQNFEHTLPPYSVSILQIQSK